MDRSRRGSRGDFTYTPSNYFFGADEFRLVATDSLGAVSNESIVSVRVDEGNLPLHWPFRNKVNTPLEIVLSTLASPTNGVPIVSCAAGAPLDGSIPVFDPTTGTL
jgi:hypothetical protein